MLRVAIQESRLAGLRREDAEDIGQMVVLRFLPRAGEIPHPLAWSRFVARDLAIRHRVRSRRKVSWTGALEGVWQPWDELEREWLVDSVLSAVGDQDRRLLGLALAGATHAEIAEQLGVQERSVGTMRRRAARRAQAARLALELSA